MNAAGIPSPLSLGARFWRLVIEQRRWVALGACGAITLIGFADYQIERNLGLGFLYFFPILLLGATLRRWHVVLSAALCAVMREEFSPFPFVDAGPPRLAMVFLAFLGAGLMSYELTRNRKLAFEHLHALEHESELRQEAEQQMRILIESSPAAILLLDAEQMVVLANQAASRLFEVPLEELTGQAIARYLPALAGVPHASADRSAFRTVMECPGRRSSGEVFLACVWFSTYQTRSGPRLAAIVADTSEGLRDREEQSLQQMLTSTRVLIGAVSHEIRNLAAAIAMVSARLARNEQIRESDDYRALTTLVEGLVKVASMELRSRSDENQTAVDLRELLEELRIIIEPSCRDNGIETRWQVADDVPFVWAERESLLQVFLNLAKNSERAMADREHRNLTVSVTRLEGRVTVELRDSGGGVPVPDNLFQPFQNGAEAAGLGLYVSRALVRAFRGELRYEPLADGSSFTVELAAAEASRS